MTLVRSAAMALLAILSCSAVYAAPAAGSDDGIPTIRVVGERPQLHDALAGLAQYEVPRSATRIAQPDLASAWQLVSMR